MRHFAKLSVLALVLLAGCTREVYLQPVGCETCSKKQEVVAPVVVPTCTNRVSCCPETITETEIITYQIYEAPAPKLVITPTDNGFRRCLKSCHKVAK